MYFSSAYMYTCRVDAELVTVGARCVLPLQLFHSAVWDHPLTTLSYSTACHPGITALYTTNRYTGVFTVYVRTYRTSVPVYMYLHGTNTLPFFFILCFLFFSCVFCCFAGCSRNKPQRPSYCKNSILQVLGATHWRGVSSANATTSLDPAEE